MTDLSPPGPQADPFDRLDDILNANALAAEEPILVLGETVEEPIRRRGGRGGGGGAGARESRGD